MSILSYLLTMGNPLSTNLLTVLERIRADRREAPLLLRDMAVCVYTKDTNGLRRRQLFADAEDFSVELISMGRGWIGLYNNMASDNYHSLPIGSTLQRPDGTVLVKVAGKPEFYSIAQRQPAVVLEFPAVAPQPQYHAA